MEKIISGIETGIPILAMIITALVAVYSIRKTAEENRVSAVHNEMTQCITDSIIRMRMVRKLLNDIANKVSYYRFPEDELVETAYDRYWREIQTISTESKLIQAKQMFVFPRELYEKMQNLINKTNEAREEAKHYNPQVNDFTPGDNELKKIVKEINSIYVDFVNTARRYVRVDALDPISAKNEKILKVEETKKS